MGKEYTSNSGLDQIEMYREKSTMQTYIARIVDIVEQHKRPRPDGAIEWGIAGRKIEQLITYIISEKLSEQKEELKRIVMMLEGTVEREKIANYIKEYLIK